MASDGFTLLLQVVVGSTLKAAVLDFCCERGSFFLLLHHESRPGAAELRAEWARLARLFAGARERLRIGALELGENEIGTDGLSGGGVASLNLTASPSFLLFRRRGVRGGEADGYTLEPPTPLPAEAPRTLAGFVSFLRGAFDAAAAPPATVDLGLALGPYLDAQLASYWQMRRLDDQLDAMAEALLGARRATAAHASQPRRFLASWLLDRRHALPAAEGAGPAPAAAVEEAARSEAKAEVGAQQVEEAQQADGRLRERLLARPAFASALDAPTAAWVRAHDLEALLREMRSEIADHLPLEPLAFLSEWLSTRPLAAAPAAARAAPAADGPPMNESEVVRAWPAVRRVVGGSAVLAHSKRLVESTLVEGLLRKGLPIDARPYSYTILYMASAQGNLPAVEKALEWGADVHVRCREGTTPLEAAAAMGHVDVTEALLAVGAHFAGSLHYAAAAGQVGVVQALQRAGAPLDAALAPAGTKGGGGARRVTALELAVANGHAQVVNYLCGCGVDGASLPVHLRDSPLLPSAAKERIAREKGEQVKASVDFYELQAFLHAHGVEAVLEAAEAGTLPELRADAEDHAGWTSLMHAAFTDDAEAARKLLALGARPSVRNKYGFSCALFAHWMESSSFRRVLRERCGAGCDVLDGNDQKGVERLAAHRERGDAADDAILRPKGLRKGLTPSAEAAAWDAKQADADGLAQTRAPPGADEDDDGAPPAVSLEAYLMLLDAEQPGVYPVGGPFARDMHAFVQSMKAATVDIVASATCPQGVTPADVFALHLYTRAELFWMINRAYRDRDREGMARWRPVVWHMCAAGRRVASAPGVYVRGVGKLFNFVPVQLYKPGSVVAWPGFTSSSADLRVACGFMYGSQDPSTVEGAIFKIWGKSPAPIEWCSFMPKEREFLFLPGTKFRVRAWYPATQANMRRGMRAEGESDDFKLRCDHLVQPVPLQVVDDDVELRKQLVHNKVVIFERD